MLRGFDPEGVEAEQLDWVQIPEPCRVRSLLGRLVRLRESWACEVAGLLGVAANDRRHAPWGLAPQVAEPSWCVSCLGQVRVVGVLVETLSRACCMGSECSDGDLSLGALWLFPWLALEDILCRDRT